MIATGSGISTIGKQAFADGADTAAGCNHL